MGYYIQIIDSTATVRLTEENIDIFKRQAQWLADHESQLGRGGGGGKTWYSWMNMSDLMEYAQSGDIEEWFRAWDFGAYIRDNEVIIDDYYSKSGQEDLMLTVMAPIIEGHIIWKGEDGEMWANTFKDGLMSTSSVVLQPASDSKPVTHYECYNCGAGPKMIELPLTVSHSKQG